MSVPFIDIHTHHPVRSEEIISVPSFFLQDIHTSKAINYPFTAGIHPWHADKFNPDEIKNMLKYLASQKELIAIGETGLDKKCQVDISIQKTVFELHIEFAELIKKPLIIHCVKCLDDIIAYKKKSTMQFILHGFNGNPELTRQLIRQGFYFSTGRAVLRQNVKLRDSIKIIPPDSLFLETDDEIMNISEIYDAVALILNCSPDDLKHQIFTNYNRIFRKI